MKLRGSWSGYVDSSTPYLKDILERKEQGEQLLNQSHQGTDGAQWG